MRMALAWLSGKLWAVVGVAITALVLLAGHFKSSRDRHRDRANRLDAALKRDAEIDEADQEIASEYSDQRRLSEQDIKNHEVPRNLRSGDDW